jgi:uncharacterized protein (DUF1330 family)
MPAYFVYICKEVTDRQSLETYWNKIGPTLEGYGARNIAAYTRFEQLEGEKIEGVAVIEFPSLNARRNGMTALRIETSATIERMVQST